MTTVDARGYSCPEPVIMLRKAMAKKDAEYTVLVDNAAAKENVTRYAEHEGYTVSVSEANGESTLTMEKYVLFSLRRGSLQKALRRAGLCGEDHASSAQFIQLVRNVRAL